MIEILQIELEGFKNVIAPIEFDYQMEGITFVNGKNGAGKSTIICEALFFALFGYSYKDKLNKASLITKKEFQTKKFKGTRVILHLIKDDVYYEIARHINYKGTTFDISVKDDVLIRKNEKLISKLQSIDDCNKFILDLIGINDSIFLNSVLFGQNLKRLVETDDKNKREIFDMIFNLSYIDFYHDKAKTKRQEYYEDFIVQKEKITSVESRIADIDFNLKQQKELLKNEDAIIEQKIERLSASIEKEKQAIKTNRKLINVEKEKLTAADADIDSITEYENKLKRYTKNYDLALAELKELDFSISVIMDKIKSKESKIKEPTPICDSCKQPIKNIAEFKDRLREEIKSLYSNKANLQAEIDLKRQERDKALKFKDKYDSLYNANKSTIETINSISRLIESYEDKISNSKEMVDFYSDEINSVESGRGIYQKMIDSLKKEKSSKIDELSAFLDDFNKLEIKIESYDYWLKNFFSANGIKKYIITAMIEELNDHLLKYSDKLGLPIYFEINNDKARNSYNIRIIKDNIEMLYEELSGGEMRRVNLAIAFAMNDLVTANSTAFNILIMDETFENLDEDGNYVVSEFLRIKAEQFNVFVITHNILLDTRNANILTVDRGSNNKILIN